MADYRLSGYTTEILTSLNGTTNSGYATSLAGGVSAWYNAWTGNGSFPSLDPALNIGVTTVGVNTVIYRSFLQFEMPSNLSSLDEDPQLKIRCSSVTGDGKISITSVDYTNFETPWNTWDSENAWKSAYRTNSGAYYEDSGNYYYTLTAGADYHTITLSSGGLAKFHCTTKGYVIVGLIEYTYDRNGNPFSAPGSANTCVLDSPSDSSPPQLVLRKPWFINDRGDDFPVDSDYTIRAQEVGVNQHGRSVPQLPFSTAIKGPISLRKKNVPYKVTT
tara:strand:+ start:100 stop:924 length:825 start_codon:yes stop_codon:yes gene_type:complete